MKRIFSILLITAMLLALTPLMGTVALAEEYATVTSENGYGVRLREGPSKAYNVIRTYGVGTTVTVLQSGLEWSQLRIGETVGWMQNKYLNFGTTGSFGYTGSTITGIGTVTVTSDNGLRVWLRSAPGGTRVELYSPGTPATLIEYGETWCHISINGQVGYMMTEFLSGVGGYAPGGSGSGGTVPPAQTVSGPLESLAINYPYPVVGDTLEAIIEPAGATVKYSWKVDGVELGTEPTFNLLARYYDKHVSLTVTGIGNNYGTLTTNCKNLVQIGQVVKGVKLDNVAPVVGDEIGAILQPSSASVEYFWHVGGVEVSNDPTYTVQESDVDKLIQLKVVGVGSYSGAAAASAEAYVVSDKELLSVELSNYYPVVGETVYAYVLPEAANAEYTWTLNGEVVSYDWYYTIGYLDLGKELRVTVRGIDPYYGVVSASTRKISSEEVTGVSLSNYEPMVGDVLYAYLTPYYTTADIAWYVDEYDYDNPALNRVGVGASLAVKASMIDKQLIAVATGNGVYSGVVLSYWTEPVIDNKVITGVEIDNTYPVVGDTITATPYPYPDDEAFDLESFQKAHSYVWTIDNEVSPTHTYQYKVKETDVGKQIRVKVVGGKYDGETYTGEAYSVYTNPVAAYNKIKGVSIYNITTDTSAVYTTPNPGDLLYAVVDPIQAEGVVHYQWYDEDGNEISGATSPYYTVKSGDAGSILGVYVWGDETEYYAGYTGYYGEAYVNTAAVADLLPLNANIVLTAPQAGLTPEYEIDYYWYEDPKTEAELYGTGSIDWLSDRHGYEIALLDQYGCYLPGETYIAAIWLDVPYGYTLVGAKVKVNGSNAIVDDGLVYYDFSTAGQQITDFYIEEIPVPVVGEKAVKKIESNPQYTMDINWTKGVDGEYFVPSSEYEAKITLTEKSPYQTKGLPKNVFTVDGASTTLSTADALGKVTITATYKADDPIIKLTADKSEVYLDGYNSQKVQFNAELLNFIGDASKVTYRWDIIDAVVNGTSINELGELTIGMYETPDRTITVRVMADLNKDGVFDEDEEAYLGIDLLSGSDTNTAIKVEIIEAPVQLAVGATGRFEVKVSNSSKGYLLYAFTPEAEQIKPNSDGAYDWKVPDKCAGEKQVVVKAISIEDPSVVATVVVKIGDENVIPKTIEEELLLEEPSIDDLLMTLELIDEEVPAFDGTMSEEPAVEPEAEEIPVVEETEEEPAVEPEAEEVPVVEETEEEPAVEPEVEETPVVEETEEEPAVEPEVEEVPAVEETEEEPAAEPVIEIVISSEEPTVEEEPEEVVIEIKDTVTGEIVADEEPVVEEEEEVLTGVVIEIKDTVTGEVIEQQPTEETKEEDKSEKKSSKKNKKDKKNSKDADEVIVEELDPVLDDLEGDLDVGESTAESLIKIRFVEMVSEIKRGNTAVFSVETEGTEQGVRWSVRRSKDADGMKVSSIDQNGLLTVSRDETAEKLIVVATSIEDETVRARWIVTVKQPSKKTDTEPVVEEVLPEETVTEETVQPETEEPVQEEPVEEEVVEEEAEVEIESEGLTEEQLQQIIKELEELEQETSVLVNF